MATASPLTSRLKTRRQAIMLFVLLLVAVGLFIHKRPTPIGAAQNFLVVSMGDSSASGEGNPDVPGSGCDALTVATMQTIFGTGADLYYLLSGNTCLTPPQWLGSPAGTPESTDDKRCHRSQRSGHRLAANAFQTAHPDLTVQFYTVACSGAAIKQYTDTDQIPLPGHGGLIDPYIGDNPTSSQQQQVNWLPSQVDQVHTKFGNRQIDALLINIGVNDVGFGRVVESCLANGFPVPFTFSCPDTTLQSAVDLRITQDLPAALDQLADQISQKLHVANVYINAYPNPTHSSQSTYCSNQGLPDMVGFLDGGETAWADQRVVRPLNQQLAAAAKRHEADGWHFASGTESGTVFDHGVCNPDSGANNRWFLTMGDSFLTQGDFHGTMHPNAASHALYASSIKSELEKQFTAPPRPTNLRSNGITASSIRIQWNGNATFPETTFQVAMKAGSRSEWSFQTVSRGSTSANFNFLFASTYDFYVRACTTLVCSDWSNGLRVPVTPAAPGNIQGTPFTERILSFGGASIDNGVTVSWQDNSTYEAGFQIAIRQADLTTYSYATAPAGSTSFGIHQLGNRLRYVIWMRACGLPTECSAWTGDVVVVSGGAVGVVLTPQPPTIQFPAPVSAPPPTLTPLMPAPPPTTAPIPQLPGASVGVPSLTPNTLSVQTGDQTTLTLNWTVPPPLVWRDLHNVDLRISDAAGVALLVRFDEQSNTLSVYKEAAGKFGPAFVPGSPNNLETNMATLYLADSSIQGSGPTGRSVTLKLNLSFKQRAAGHTFSAEVLATDDSGRTQGFDAVGLVQVQRADR